MKTFYKFLMLSLMSASLSLYSCGSDDGKKSSSSSTEVSSTVEDISGPELSSSEVSTRLALSEVPNVSDQNGSTAIAQGKSVSAQFSGIIAAMPSAPIISKGVSQISDTTWSTTSTSDGITYTYTIVDEANKYKITYSAKGTSETNGNTVDGIFYQATVLKNRRGGYLKYDYGIFSDLNMGQNGYTFDGFYEANFKIVADGKLTLVYSYDISSSGVVQGVSFDSKTVYGGTLVVNADKSGRAETTYKVTSSGRDDINGTYCVEWNSNGATKDCK